MTETKEFIRPFEYNVSNVIDNSDSDNNRPRRIVFVGGGMVGQAILYSCMNQSIAEQYVMIDVREEFARGLALDMEDCLDTLPSHCSVTAGGYDSLKHADLCVISAGRPQLPGETRLQMVQDNANIMRNIAENVVQNEFKGITIIVANPVDIMTMVYMDRTGFDPKRVISSGCVLDSARLRHELSLGLKNEYKQNEINAYIFGEHGDSSVAVFSSASISGMNVKDMLKYNNLDEKLCEVETFVRRKAYEIIQRKQFTNYGVGVSVTKIIKSILYDQRDHLPVGILLDGNYNVQQSVVASVLTVVGRQGIIKTIDCKLSDDELKKFQNSCDIISQSFMSVDKDPKSRINGLQQWKGYLQN